MSYEAICKAITGHGEGIYKFGQSSFITLVDENRAGICRGVCTAWLIAKAQGNDYLKEILNPVETTGLLHKQSTARQASDFQTEYKDVKGDFPDSPSEATLSALRVGGLATLGEWKSDRQLNFADDASVLGQLVLTSKYRYSILSIKGIWGGHSLAFYRPWVFLGKSSSCYFFDPNFGEFKLEGSKGIELCLAAVATAYKLGFSKGYRFWGFS